MQSQFGKLFVCVLLAAAAFAWAEPPASQPASKPTASAPAGNVAQGILVAKGEDWISVKGKDDKAGVRYTTDDKAVIEYIARLTIPSQVKVTFKQAGDSRKILVVQTSPIASEGVIEGVITAKGDKWIEAKPATGDEPAERYLTYGEANDVVAAIAAIKVGDKVKITWKHIERKRVMKLEKLGGE